MNAVTSCKKKEHNYIIKIGTNFKSELIYICFKSQKKVRTSFKLANIFRSEKRYIEEYVASKCSAIFKKLKEFEVSQALNSEIILDKKCLRKNA
ncbi:MAG: hypothetical protein ACJAYY_002862 [Paraglaciecola sp.]